MPNVTPIDPFKPHITIAIARPDPRWSKGVMVIGGGYGGETNEEISSYFTDGVLPAGTREHNGWRIVDLPYDHGDWIPPAPEPVAYRPCAPEIEKKLQMMDEVFDEVLAEDHLHVR